MKLQLAEIWGGYAVALYDSLAESFMGMPVSLEATFGEPASWRAARLLRT